MLGAVAGPGSSLAQLDYRDDHKGISRPGWQCGSLQMHISA